MNYITEMTMKGILNQFENYKNYGDVLIISVFFSEKTYKFAYVEEAFKKDCRIVRQEEGLVQLQHNETKNMLTFMTPLYAVGGRRAHLMVIDKAIDEETKNEILHPMANVMFPAFEVDFE